MISEEIKFIVADLLSEENKTQPDKPTPGSTKKSKVVGIEASTGRGRFSRGVNEAGALASENPQQLMKNLNIKGASGSDDLSKIENILSQAIVGPDAMKKVYISLSRVSRGDKKGLRVNVAIIKLREAIKYLYHTLVGAQNAKVLAVSSTVQIENNDGSVLIYQGKKNSWKD